MGKTIVSFLYGTSISLHCNTRDLYINIFRQARYFYSFSSRRDSSEMLTVNLIDLLKIIHVADEDAAFYNVIKCEPGFF